MPKCPATNPRGDCATILDKNKTWEFLVQLNNGNIPSPYRPHFGDLSLAFEASRISKIKTILQLDDSTEFIFAEHDYSDFSGTITFPFFQDMRFFTDWHTGPLIAGKHSCRGIVEVTDVFNRVFRKQIGMSLWDFEPWGPSNELVVKEDKEVFIRPDE